MRYLVQERICALKADVWIADQDDVDRISLRGDDLAAVELHPAALKAFIMSNRQALLVEAKVAP